MPFVIAVVVALLAGCTAFERGAEQGDPAVDRVTGCPDLSGAYALRPTTLDDDPDPSVDPAKPVRFEGGVFSPEPGRGFGSGDLAAYDGVIVRSNGTHALELQFVVPSRNVMSELESIRQHQRPRYAEWYALMQPAGRAAFIARNGESALQARLRELGPDPGPVVRLDRGPDFTCEEGWVVLPREYLPPVRMTLDPAGDLVFEAKEWTYSAWGGWGGQSWQVRTGAYLGTARWARDASVKPWNADEVAQDFVLARPADEVEREQAVAVESARRSAQRRFADPEAVRDALRPLLPAGLSIIGVDITELPYVGPRVRLRVAPGDPLMDSEEQRRRLEWFLAALKEGDPGFIEDREVVKRVTSSEGVQRHEFEIFLDTHPAVQPARTRATTAANALTAAPEAAPGRQPIPLLVPVLRAASPASDTAPSGFAPLSVVDARLQPLMAEGCRTTQLRYAGDAVMVSGEATRMACVSTTLRSIDGVVSPSGARVELMQATAEAAGGYRFEIRLPPSPLTRE